jgi:hypothetical protein
MFDKSDKNRGKHAWSISSNDNQTRFCPRSNHSSLRDLDRVLYTASLDPVYAENSLYKSTISEQVSFVLHPEHAIPFSAPTAIQILLALRGPKRLYTEEW